MAIPLTINKPFCSLLQLSVDSMMRVHGVIRESNIYVFHQTSSKKRYVERVHNLCFSPHCVRFFNNPELIFKMLLIPSTSYFPLTRLMPFCQSASLISAPKIPLVHRLKQRPFLMRDAKSDHLPVDITCPEVTISPCIYFLRIICFISGFPEIQHMNTNLNNYYRSIKP